METNSKHGLLDLWLKTPLQKSHIEAILKVIRNRFTVLQEVRHQYESEGETILCMLEESHFALHTYPEQKYVSLDLYSCDPNLSLLPLLDEIRSELPVQRSCHSILKRGDPSQRQISRAQDETRRLSIEPGRYTSNDLPLA